jgi:hypothetical protein
MKEFLWGALAMSSLAIAAFFFKFWRDSRDRLFAAFGAAFGVFALNWLLLALFNPGVETRHYVYVVRLLAFILLIIGIIDKNRSGRDPTG